jgi:hypothetical protein
LPEITIEIYKFYYSFSSLNLKNLKRKAHVLLLKICISMLLKNSSNIEIFMRDEGRTFA